MRASRVVLPDEKRKSECVKDPTLRAPLALGGWGGEGYFASMKAGIFCVCESRLSHRSPIFFLQTDRRSVACYASRSCLIAQRGQPQSKSLIVIVCRLLRVTVPVPMFG